jgi:hypothetical protein
VLTIGQRTLAEHFITAANSSREPWLLSSVETPFPCTLGKRKHRFVENHKTALALTKQNLQYADTNTAISWLFSFFLSLFFFLSVLLLGSVTAD